MLSRECALAVLPKASLVNVLGDNGTPQAARTVDEPYAFAVLAKELCAQCCIFLAAQRTRSSNVPLTYGCLMAIGHLLIGVGAGHGVGGSAGRNSKVCIVAVDNQGVASLLHPGFGGSIV